MQPTKVFISYRHLEMSFKEHVELVFRRERRIEVLSDSDILTGKDLHEEISKLINESQIIVAIVTKSWLVSHETRDELVRAHERGKHIICFLNSDDSIKLDDLPFFLRGPARIEFDANSIDAKLTILVQSISSYDEHWKSETLNAMNEIRDAMASARQLPSYKRYHLSDCVLKARKEVRDIVSQDKFSRRVSYEDNFLLAASPYFKSAHSIYALSIARISTFWNDQNANAAVKRYISEQGGADRKVIRLFVFENATEANMFKNILNSNYDSYGKNSGGVFFTDRSSYIDLLNSVANQDFIRDVEGLDFGILKYENNNTQNSKDTLLATLSKTEFEVTTITDPPLMTDIIPFCTTFEKLLEINEGEYSEQFKIARWHPNLTRDFDTYTSILTKLFPESKANILHIVLINSNGRADAVRSSTNQLISEFEKKSDALEIKNIWSYDRHDMAAHDGQYFGLINIGDKYDLIIGVEFENEKALKNYYEHSIHSAQREAIYTAILPEIATKFNKMKSITPKARASRERISKIFEDIERDMIEYIYRIDLLVEEPVEKIVRRSGYPF